MTKRELRKTLYKDKDRDLSFRLSVFFRITSVRYVEETNTLNLSYGSFTIHYFEERYNFYNPLTWIVIIFSMIISIISLFITDFLSPVISAFISLPSDLRRSTQWNKRVLDKEAYNEVLNND